MALYNKSVVTINYFVTIKFSARDPPEPPTEYATHAEGNRRHASHHQLPPENVQGAEGGAPAGGGAAVDAGTRARKLLVCCGRR